MQSRTPTVVIAAPQERVFSYVADLENLPKWAYEFCQEVKVADGKYIAVTPQGELVFEVQADAETGVIDFLAGPTETELALFPTRVVGLPGGWSAFSFTFVQAPGVEDEAFEAQYESLQRELVRLKQVLESSVPAMS